MTNPEREREPTAVSGGDGSLGGAALGGSVGGPDAGVIKDPVGREVGIPLTTDPAEEPTRIDPSMEPATAEREDEATEEDSSLRREEPVTNR